MIFWSGHGILIPLFGIIGMVVGSFAGGFLARATGANPSAMVGLGMICGGLGSAAMVWLYALTMGKTVEQSFLDPATRQPVVMRKRHTFFFIPAFAWAVIASVLGLLFAGSGALTWYAGKITDSVSDTGAPGAAALREAERIVGVKSHGVANGNSAEARIMAGEFSTLAKEFRNMAIEKGKQATFSVSGGEFLTFCQVSEHGTAFIVHVPDLRKFTPDAKDAMATVAWVAAQAAVSRQQPPAQKVAVGLRGVILYDAIMIGKPVDGFRDKPEAGILRRHKGDESEVLRPFFAAPALDVELMDADQPDSVVAAKRADAPVQSGTPPAPAVPEPATTPTPAPAPATVPAADATLPTPVREWKSADGRPLRASLVRFTDAAGANAEFKREDGVAFTIPVEKFAAEDKAELERIFAANKGAGNP